MDDVFALADTFRGQRLKIEWTIAQLVDAARLIAIEAGAIIAIETEEVDAFERQLRPVLPLWYQFARAAILLDGLAEPHRGRRFAQMFPPARGVEELVRCYTRLDEDGRVALLQIARSMAGAAGPGDTRHRDYG